MPAIQVWTKQHRSVWDTLVRVGVYRARREFISLDLQEHAPLVLPVYDWLATHMPQTHRPPQAEYPVWVSFHREATMLPGPDTVILELSLDPELITPINIAKWGAMLNYSYLPADEADRRQHQKLLASLGISDARAFMTPFYPEVRGQILDSWQRLFDDTVQLGNDFAYGTIWEVRSEWVTNLLT